MPRQSSDDSHESTRTRCHREMSLWRRIQAMKQVLAMISRPQFRRTVVTASMELTQISNRYIVLHSLSTDGDFLTSIHRLNGNTYGKDKNVYAVPSKWRPAIAQIIIIRRERNGTWVYCFEAEKEKINEKQNWIRWKRLQKKTEVEEMSSEATFSSSVQTKSNALRHSCRMKKSSENRTNVNLKTFRCFPVCLPWKKHLFATSFPFDVNLTVRDRLWRKRVRKRRK